MKINLDFAEDVPTVRRSFNGLPVDLSLVAHGAYFGMKATQAPPAAGT